VRRRVLFPAVPTTRHQGQTDNTAGHFGGVSAACRVPPCQRSGRLTKACHSPRRALWQRVWRVLGLSVVNCPSRVGSTHCPAACDVWPGGRQMRTLFFPARPSWRGWGWWRRNGNEEACRGAIFRAVNFGNFFPFHRVAAWDNLPIVYGLRCAGVLMGEKGGICSYPAGSIRLSLGGVRLSDAGT
jgi:hypothetical protein